MNSNNSDLQSKIPSKDSNNIEKLPYNPGKNSSKSRFLEKWRIYYPWLRFDSNKGLMYCVWCEEYSSSGTKIDNNMTRGTSNFKSSTLREHLLLKDHDLVRSKNESKNNDAIAMSGNQENKPTIASIFHSTKEKPKIWINASIIQEYIFDCERRLSIAKRWIIEWSLFKSWPRIQRKLYTETGILDRK